MATIKIVNASRSEGPLYKVMGEDGELIVFDCGVSVLGVDGKVYVHKAFVVRGAVRSLEGFWCPNYNYKNLVAAFVARVEDRGVIDLRYWEELREESPEDREAYNLKIEADERAWEGCR